MDVALNIDETHIDVRVRIIADIYAESSLWELVALCRGSLLRVIGGDSLVPHRHVVASINTLEHQ